MTPRLVALDLPGGPAFVDALRRAWDAGDAVFPVEQRLPPAARADVIATVAPDVVVGADGHETPLPRPRPAQPAAELPPLEDGDALVIATSGSTGARKGAVLTHDAVAASARATSARLGVTDDDHWLACLPVSHIGGLAVVCRALVTGTALTVHPRFDAALVDECEATMTALVRTVVDRIDATRWRVIVIGGGPAPGDRPANVVTTYGLTETGSGVVYDGHPLDGVDVRIDPGGEIHLRGPMLLRTYRDGTSLRDGDGWLATGDLGEWRPDGALHVLGRRGDMIITGGENVWPEPVERALLAHPLVADVAVAGQPDPEWGQVVTAYVVPSPDGAPTLDQLRAVAKDTLASYQVPRRLELVPAIPRTSLGKPRRALLGQ